MGKLEQVKVPDIGDFDEVDVVEVIVSEGDRVGVDDPLITLESDKASMEVPSTVAGVVRSISVKVGDKVGEGHVIVEVEVGDEDAAEGEAEGEAEDEAGGPTEREQEEEEQEKEEEEEEEEAPGETDDTAEEAPSGEQPAEEADEEAAEDSAEKLAEKTEPASAEAARPRPSPSRDVAGEPRAAPPHASPSVRRFARELGVDLEHVTGSGPKGRILEEDVQEFVKRALLAPAAAAAAPEGRFTLPAMPEIDFSRFGPVEEAKLSRIRIKSAQNLHRSWLHVPRVTQFDEADITELEEFRNSQKAEAERKGVKLTPLAFLMKAAAGALREFPDLNSSLHPEGDRLVVKKYVHLGIAVDTPNGLVVPVVRDVDKKGIYELAGELGEVSARARENKLRPEDWQGASFTISSLGGIGGTGFTPIINAPEVAIMGVARNQWRPVWNGSEFVPRLILPFSVAYDHRVVDGAMAVRFTTHLAGLLSDLRRLLL